MRALVPVLLLLSVPALAGTNNLPVETGSVIQRQHVNKFQTALAGDLVPRDSSGVVGDTTGSLGQSSLRWLNLFTKKVSLLFSASGNSISLNPPATIPSSYALTFPGSLPSGPSYVVVDNTGAMSFGNAGPIGNSQTITTTGTYTVPTNASILMLWGVGGGGGGGANGAGSAGGAGGTTCISSGSACTGTIYLQAYGGNGGATGSFGSSLGVGGNGATASGTQYGRGGMGGTGASCAAGAASCSPGQSGQSAVPFLAVASVTSGSTIYVTIGPAGTGGAATGTSSSAGTAGTAGAAVLTVLN